MRALVSVDFDFFFKEYLILEWGHSENPFFRSMGDAIWGARIAGAIQTKLNLIELQTSEKWRNPPKFWREMPGEKGLEFGTRAEAWVGDSHGLVAQHLLSGLEGGEYTLYNFDAHHDLNYNCGESLGAMETNDDPVMCDNWMFNLVLQVPEIKRIVQVYPDWRLGKCPMTGFDMGEGYDALIEARAAFFAERGVELETTYYSLLEQQSLEVARVGVCLSSSWVPPWFERRFSEFLSCMPRLLRLVDLFDPLFEVRPEWDKTWDELAASFNMPSCESF